MPRKRRRGRGEGALFQLHTPDCPPPNGDGERPSHTCTGQWRAVLVDDRKRRIYLHAKTKAKAQDKLNAAKQEIAEHGNLTRGRSTVEQWLTFWLEEIAPRKTKPGTLAAYQTAVTKHIVPFIGPVRLNQLTRHHVRQLHRDLERYPKERGEGTLAFGTIATAHAVLSAALTDAVKEGLIRINIARDERPRGTSPTRGYLTTAQARTLLASTTGDRLGSRWIFALLSGARQGERLGLRWDHVELGDGDPVVDISWQLHEVRWSHGCNTSCGKRPASCPKRQLRIPIGWEHQVVHGAQILMRPKAGRRKVLPLVAPTVAALRQRHEQYEAEREHYTTDHGLVWCHPDGRPVGRRTDYQDWRDALTTARLPLIELHGLRHTTASLLDELGVHEGIVQEILGHSRVTTTRGYTHRDRTQARAALERLGAALELR